MKKNIFKKIILAVVAIVLVFLPYGIFTLYATRQPHVYSQTYYAALVDKVNLLEKNKNRKKIILIGGSNVAFGFNSKLIEEEFNDYKVINFGLYAALGTKIMLDLSLDYIGEGDLVFVIPEADEQSLSLYFDSLSTLKATEDKTELINKLPEENKENIKNNYFSFVKERSQYSQIINPGETVYRRNNFNEYMDIEYLERDNLGQVVTDEFGHPISLRTKNIMKGNHFITPTIEFSTLGKNNNFYNYLNEYSNKVKKRGGECYFSFCPVNELAVQSTEEQIDNYYWLTRQKINFKCIGHPEEYLIDPHYFYDTNFHLNDAGSIYRTYLFISDLLRDVFSISKQPSFEIPDLPEYPTINPAEEEDSESAKYFNMEEIDGGYYIESVKSEYSNLASMDLPSIYNKKYVVGIREKAFVNSSLQQITIPESYAVFDNGCFDDCLSLTKVFLQQLSPSKLIVDFTGGLINSVNAQFKFYIPNKAITAYKTDYNWQFYSSYFVGYDYEA